MERTELWTARDVTRLLALAESERRYYEDIVTFLPIAVAILAADRTIVSFNQAFRRTLRLPPGQLAPQRIEQVLPSDALVERIRMAHVHADAAPLIVMVGERSLRATAVAMPVRTDDAQPETLLVLEDLPATPPSEAAPPQNIPAILWQADPVLLSFRQVGGAAREILGYPSAQWLESPRFFSERIHPEDRSEVLAVYMRILSTGGEASAEFRALTASGDSIWVRETISVPPPGSAPRLISGVLTRIESRRELELLSQHAARFDALRELSRSLSHELNNQLQIVVMEASQEDVALREAFAAIADAAARMTEVTRRLSEFAHPQPRPASEVALGPLLEAMPGALPTLHTVMADDTQLREAIRALASVPNARISCEPAFINELLSRATLKPGSYIRIEISPSSAVLPSPFNPNLARAYANIRSWGGDILQTADALQIYLRTPETTAAVATPIPRPQSGPATILVVDDQAGIRSLVEKILKREGYRVLEASSAEQALTAASAHRGAIDLLLTDVMLPRMNGRELADRITRADPRVRVLFMSGETGGLLPPAAALLQKPFTMAALLAAIRQALA